MVKVVKEGPAKQNRNSSNKLTRVIKQPAVQKPVKTVPLKRLLMLQRRLTNLLDEKYSWEERNKELSDSLKAEQLLSASLRKESFRWQQLYHENEIKLNMYKVKQAKMAQTLTTCLREINSTYPHMVAFSESVTNNKIRLTELLNSLPSEGYDCLPRKSDRVSYDTNIRSDKPMKQRVGPMVKGHPIIKPKIMLKRVIMPQPQEQDPVNSDNSVTEENNQLTPIPEENEHVENECMRHVSMRPKRRNLGSLCRIRRQQEKIEKERDKEIKSPVAYDGDSSDSEAAVEPLVRLKDVSRLFQNSSLVKMDSVRSGGEGESSSECGSRRRVPVSVPKKSAEDPLEGSSWMYGDSRFRPSHKTLDRRSSLYKSDSSDEEENTMPLQTKPSSASPMNSLINKTFTVFKKKSLSANDTSHQDLENSDCAEPDSTNNIGESNSSSKETSKSDIRNSNSPENVISLYSLSTEYDSMENAQDGRRLSKNRLTVRLLKVPDRPSLHSSTETSDQSLSKRRSSVNGQAICSPEPLGKRIRKQKIHLYPGEDDLEPTNKTKSSKIPKLSTSRKSSCEKRTSTEISKSCPKRSSSERVSNSLEENSAGSSQKSGKKRKSIGIVTDKLQKSKKSSLKKSLYTPRSSSSATNLNGRDSEGALRPRRMKTAINYKESPLNVKQRRP